MLNVIKQALEVSFKTCEHWIAYWQLQISSGAYKSRKVERCGVMLEGQALLDDTFGILHNHVTHLSEIADNLKTVIYDDSPMSDRK